MSTARFRRVSSRAGTRFRWVHIEACTVRFDGPHREARHVHSNRHLGLISPDKSVVLSLPAYEPMVPPCLIALAGAQVAGSSDGGVGRAIGSREAFRR